MPKIAVITPTYNRGDNGLLLKAMRSVSGQTYTDFVHLVVDHGSTDSTERVVGKYMAQDPRVFYDKIERDPNYDKGSVVGCNYGINMVLRDDRFSDVEAMCYLHDDDMLPQNSLWLRHDTMFRNGNDKRLVYGFLGVCNNDMRLSGVVKGPAYRDPLDIARELVRRQREQFPNHTVFLRRDLLKELGGFDENLFWSDDRDMSVRALEAAGKGHVSQVSDIVYYFRVHAKSAGALNPYRMKSDQKYFGHKHGRTSADNFVENIGRFVTRPQSFLPEGVKNFLRPIRMAITSGINKATGIELDPYIEEIEKSVQVHV